MRSVHVKLRQKLVLKLRHIVQQAHVTVVLSAQVLHVGRARRWTVQLNLDSLAVHTNVRRNQLAEG